MPTLICAQSGDFTAASTWRVVDNTSYLDSEAQNTIISTTNLDSPTFTPGAITVDGIAIKVRSRATSPTGTFTVTLRNATAGTNVTSVTVNVADLNVEGNTTSGGIGWCFFKFSAPQLLLAATNYLVQLVCSSTGTQITVWRNATTNNWARCLRTTTTAAPGVSDQLIVCGEFTGAGTGNDFTVTMNNNTTTSFGPVVSGGPPQGIVVSQRGRWVNAVAASSTYEFRWKGVFWVGSGGICNIGTVGSPVPSTSTVTYYMDSAVVVDTGFRIEPGGTFTAIGATKTPWTYLTSDRTAGQTVIPVTTTSGWAANDQLYFAPTGSNNTDTEVKTISTVDSATQVTLSAGLTNPHAGTNYNQAEVCNITRNVKIRGASSVLRGYILQPVGTAVSDFRYVEFFHMGSGTTDRRAITYRGTTGSIRVEGCSVYDGTASQNVWEFVGTAHNNFTVTNNVLCNNANQSILVNGTSGTTWSVTNNVVMGGGDAISGFVVSNAGRGNTSGNVVTGRTSASAEAFVIEDATAGLNVVPANALDNNVVHNNASGARIGPSARSLVELRGTINNFKSYHNGLDGLRFSFTVPEFTISNSTFLGNSGASSANASLALAGDITNLTLSSCTFAGSTFAGANTGSIGILFRGATNPSIAFFNVQLNNCNFGVASAPNVAHTVADLSLSTSLPQGIVNVYGDNTNLASTNRVINLSSNTLHNLSFVRLQRVGSAGSYRSFFRGGQNNNDSAIFNTAAPSERVTPASASLKAFSGVRVKQVPNGSTCTPTFNVRKSAIGDGAAYAGAQPRLIVLKNEAAGILNDTVLATMTAANGTWEALTGTTAAVTDNAVLEFVVDCDGTAGWINVDDVTFTVS